MRTSLCCSVLKLYTVFNLNTTCNLVATVR